jgi:VWFA-related protein
MSRHQIVTESVRTRGKLHRRPQKRGYLEGYMKSARFILFFAMATSAWTQEGPTISVNVNVVSLLATVHDRDGGVVKNLKADDFVLLEDGKPQPISYFSREADLPLTVGLLVDTSRSQTGVLEQERHASYRFLDQTLRPDKDRAFVMNFDERVEILQGLTSSRSELESALNNLRVPGNYGTLIFSAVKDSSENIMRKQEGRKALLLLTDGVAYKDPISVEAAIEFAQRANAIIFSIRFSDHISARRPIRAAILAKASERGKKGLKRMAEETGGVSYEVTKDQSIEAIYSKIEDVLRNQYSIGYTPSRLTSDGKYHKIKLNTRNRHLIVRARDGYYAQ